MLDNLANVDLSGLDGYISYTYDNSIIQASSLMMSVGVLIFLTLLGCGLYILFTGTKSKKYREFVSDMYVVGKIKQYAVKSGVDLEKEIEIYNKKREKERNEDRSLPYVVEGKLKEEISEDKEKKK